MANDTRIKTFVRWFLNTQYFQNWASDNQNDFINSPDRAERCIDAAEHGEDGSTHAESIQDMREAFKGWIADRHSYNGYPLFEAGVDKHFDDLELWFENKGTLHNRVGY